MKLKTILDYYELIFEKYPTISKSDIKKILQYGWKLFYLFNSLGSDVLITRQLFIFYVGSLMRDSLKWFNYYRLKMRRKLRILYKKKKIEWNGYYYFARTSRQYEAYLSLINKRGRRRKNFIFEKVYMYKLYDECNLSNNGSPVIFRIPMNFDRGFTWYYDKLVTDKAELVTERPSLKFSDILLSSDNYEFITDYLHKYKRNKNGK